MRQIAVLTIVMMISEMLYASEVVKKLPEKSVMKTDSVHFYINSETPDYILDKIKKSKHSIAFTYHPSNLLWVRKTVNRFSEKIPVVFFSGKMSSLVSGHVDELAAYYNFDLIFISVNRGEDSCDYSSDLLRKNYSLSVNRNNRKGLTDFTLRKGKSNFEGVKLSTVDNDSFIENHKVIQGLVFSEASLCFINIDREKLSKCEGFNTIVVFSDNEDKKSDFLENGE